MFRHETIRMQKEGCYVLTRHKKDAKGQSFRSSRFYAFVLIHVVFAFVSQFDVECHIMLFEKEVDFTFYSQDSILKSGKLFQVLNK